jgi:hypothetical protein
MPQPKKILPLAAVTGSFAFSCRLRLVDKAIKQSNKVGRQDKGSKASVVQP